MKILKAFTRFLISSIVLLSTLYAVLTACIVFLKLSGTLAEGRPMYIDMEVPTWTELIIVEAVCLAVVGTGLFGLRHLNHESGNVSRSPDAPEKRNE